MVLQVGTTNFQSTAGESFRSPVNTFVEPVTILPKTGLMDLAQSLSTVNPVLQKYLGNVIEEEKQKGIQAGQLEVLQSSPAQIDKFKKELEEKEGKRFARNFVGGNMYMQYGIEKQLAINLGNASEAKTKKFFSEYMVDVELPDGTVVKQPLSQFDINSKEFQGAVNEFQETSLVNTRGIRPELVTNHLLPKQNLALAKVYRDQETKLAEAKIEQANLLFNNSVINSWFSIDNFNDSIELNLIDDNYTEEDRRKNNGLSQGEFLALEELQNNVNSMVERGLPASVSPASMLTLIKTNALQILDYYEKNNLDMDMAQEEIEEYIDWIGNLKVTNGLPLRTFYIQGGENKIEAIMSDINKKKAEAIKNQNDYNKVETQRTIINTLNNLDFSRTDFSSAEEALTYYKQIGNTLDSLATEYSEQIEFLYKQYDLRNFSVDNFFFDLEARYDQGEISQEDALKELTNVMMALGPNASKEDRTRYTNLKKYLGATDGKSLEKRFPEVANLKKFGLKKVGEANKYGVYITKSASDTEQMEDLNLELNRLVKKHGGLSTVFTTDDGKKMTVKNWYLGEIRKILDNEYEFYDDAYNFEEPVPIEGVVKKGNGDGATVNLDQQKILIYDRETKLFNEVDVKNMPKGTIPVAINGQLTNEGLELKDELNIDSFENFNYKLYNRNFENKKTIEKNEKLLKDDLEAGVFTEGGVTTFEVESGDTLSGIANDLDTSVEAIKKANGLTSDTIQIGETLVIPEGITDLNKVKAPEFDINKLITEKDHPFKPVRQKHNFQVIYNLAKKTGIKFPEVVAAQFGVESVYGSKVTGTNNYFGIKADPQDIKTGNFTEADTFEEIDGKKVKVKAKFKNFTTLEESIQHYKKFWNDDIEDRKGIVNVNTAEEAIIRLKENGYATDSDYVKLVTDVLNDAIRNKLF
jgi:LysM repeat protein